MLDTNFWKNKRVFLTGHTGFKGGWLSLTLQSLGATVKGFALAPPTDPNLFTVARIDEGMASQIGDIRDFTALQSSLHDFIPDIVLHLAAQPLVRASYEDPVGTYSTNVMGTVNLLEAARTVDSVRVILNVTSDKCYENQEWIWGYRESDPVGGHDPYSSSKGCAELITTAYRRSFLQDRSGPALASARAGNVIGGGDWAQDRLIPDVLRALDRSEPPVIRNPNAIRPWQHVLEPLSGYLLLAERLWQKGNEFAEAWNLGPADGDARTVQEVVQQFIGYRSDPATWSTDSLPHPHEAHYLKLDCSKARGRLNWAPTWTLATALKKTVDWYEAWRSGEDMHAYSLAEIHEHANAPVGMFS